LINTLFRRANPRVFIKVHRKGRRAQTSWRKEKIEIEYSLCPEPDALSLSSLPLTKAFVPAINAINSQ
jgi:hypothetical protein